MALKDGLYSARQRISNRTALLVVMDGIIKVDNARIISSEILESFYDTIVPYTKEKSLYDVQWFIDGQLKETMALRASYPVAKYKINLMKQGAYKSDKLVITKHK